MTWMGAKPSLAIGSFKPRLELVFFDGAEPLSLTCAG